MTLHFTINGNKKDLIKAIETELGIKAKYMGTPSFAYQIGDYTVGKDGSLSWEDGLGGDPKEFEHSASVIDACVSAGFEPLEWEELKEQWEEPNTDGLTIAMPIEYAEPGNLMNLLAAKGDLIKKALGIEDLTFTMDEQNITFPWIRRKTTSEETQAYTKFISALCKMAKEQKRITAKAKAEENEKYAFRCFLLRLGFIGNEYKQDRKILLKNLDGSSAFKTERKEE